MSHRERTRCQVVAVGLVAAVVAAGPGPAQQSAGELAARVTAAVRAAAPDLWGIVLVATDGEVRCVEASGTQDESTGRGAVPIDRQSLFDLGPLADRLTVLGALRLCDQKHWKLDEPVGRRLPNWPDDKAAITWRMLIEHTSGLPPLFDPAVANAARRPVLAAIAACPLDDRPGNAFHWSSVNCNLLALLLEQCGGKDFEAVMRSRVFAPAGMKTAAFVGEREVDPAHVTWRRGPTGTHAPANDHPWNWGHRGARGLLVSADDLSALAAALCQTRLLDEQDRAVLLQRLDAGALRVQQVVRAGVSWTQLLGATPGYRARVLLQPQARAWIVLLTGERELDALELAVAAAVAPALPAAVVEAAAPPSVSQPPIPQPPTPQSPGATPAVAVDDEAVLRFAGVFELPTGGRFEVRRRGDRGLEILGLGRAASVRASTGRGPVDKFDEALRRCEDRGLAALEPLVLGRGEPKADCFANGPALVAARRLIAEVLPRLGSGVELQFAGTELSPQRLSWLRARGRDGAVWLRIGWTRQGEIGTLQEQATAPPFALSCQVERPDWATGRAGDVPVTLSIEGRGAGRTLVFEDAAGIVECRWAADLR